MGNWCLHSCELSPNVHDQSQNAWLSIIIIGSRPCSGANNRTKLDYQNIPLRSLLDTSMKCHTVVVLGCCCNCSSKCVASSILTSHFRGCDKKELGPSECGHFFAWTKTSVFISYSWKCHLYLNHPLHSSA